MKNLLKRAVQLAGFLGIDVVRLGRFVVGFPGYLRDYLKVRAQASPAEFKIGFMPILDDKFKSSGMSSGHYFHQDLLVARKIYAANPEDHIDIGSRIDGFVAHLAIFRKVLIVDIRERDSAIENVEFIAADMMGPIDSKLADSCTSISCLHALEHFGLGRYGDPIDVNGHLKGFQNIFRILKSGGIFYFSVPIGPRRIEFNAHRVFDLQYLLNLFDRKFEVISFSYVDDLGSLHEDAELSAESILSNCGCYYGCGIFELRKLA